MKKGVGMLGQSSLRDRERGDLPISWPTEERSERRMRKKQQRESREGLKKRREFWAESL